MGALALLPCHWRQPVSRQTFITLPGHTTFAGSAPAFSFLLRWSGLRRQQSWHQMPGQRLDKAGAEAALPFQRRRELHGPGVLPCWLEARRLRTYPLLTIGKMQMYCPFLHISAVVLFLAALSLDSRPGLRTMTYHSRHLFKCATRSLFVGKCIFMSSSMNNTKTAQRIHGNILKSR